MMSAKPLVSAIPIVASAPARTPLGVRVVAIGGGTGLSSVLSGLKAHVGREIGSPSEGLTAIVTVTDNGGSSGRLREEFGMLPPGDIRNCLVALAEDEQLLTHLFRYRFKGDGTLGGHSFGNLFLTALASVTGDFLEAVKVSSEVLAVRGRIFPATMDDVHLIAELADGRWVAGETEIAMATAPVRRVHLSCEESEPLEEALEAIAAADLIVIGPGSLYTSIVPNLLVPGIADAIAKAGAPVLFICNCMTQPGETDGYTVEDHMRVLTEHAPAVVPDMVLVNALPVSAALREKYLAKGAVQVALGFGRSGALPDPGDYEVAIPDGSGARARLIARNVVDESDLVRHDPAKLARVVLDIIGNTCST
jgi:uncharacterized cofD-like protein